MKSSFIAVTATLVATLALACSQSGSSAGCLAASCDGNSSSYEVCDQGGGTVEYNFNGTSCSCSADNEGECASCRSTLASYCGVVLVTVAPDATVAQDASSGTESGSVDGSAGDATSDSGDSGNDALGSDGPVSDGAGVADAGDSGNDALGSDGPSNADAGDSGNDAPSSDASSADSGDSGLDASTEAEAGAPNDSGGG